MKRRSSLYARPVIVRGEQCTGGAGRLWLRAVGTMAPAFVPWTLWRALARDLPETALHAASRRPTTQPSAAPFTCSVAWVGEAAHGDVNHPHINGMQGVRGSNPLSSTPGQRPSQGPISSGSAASGSKSAAICLQGRSDRPTRPGAVGVIARSTRGHRAAGGSVVHDEGRIGWARQGRSKPRQRLILTRRVREDAFKLARARDDQLIGEVAVTVVVRSVPGSTVQCGA
jgi:hypothetical protein